MNFKSIILSFLLICCFYSFAISKGDTILYMSDNVNLNEDFDSKYINLLSDFIKKSNKDVEIKKIVGFDVNTTESIDYFNIFKREYNPKALILMVGESNYHNIYGFSKYITNKERMKGVVIDDKQKTLSSINNELYDVYAKEKKSKIEKLFSVAYRSVFADTKNKTFHPQVIPHFYALDDDFRVDYNIISAVEAYKHATMLMRNKEYDKAKDFLNGLIENKKYQSMFFYALGCIELMKQNKDAELKALKLFEEGILIDPLNKENICYKGLLFLFTMYKGSITSEVLFFSRLLNSSCKNISDEVSAINTINTTDYDRKIQVINDWILFDIDELKRQCRLLEIPLIFDGYPEETKVNSLVYGHVQGTANISYIENKSQPNEDTNFFAYRVAQKMYEFLKEKNILK